MTRIVVDAPPIQQYIKRVHSDTGTKITIMHVLGAAAGRAIADVPAMNCRVVFNKVVPNDTCDVGFAVDVGNGADLAPIKIVGADQQSPVAIANYVREQTVLLRSGVHPHFNASSRFAEITPTFLMKPAFMVASFILGGLNKPFLGQQGQPLGAVFISNVGSLGIEEVFLAPVPLARASVYISLGTTTPRAVVRSSKVIVVPQFTLCLTGDHRIIDGVQSAFFFNALTNYLRFPELLD